MEIEELAQNIQRLLGIAHQINAENDRLKNEVAKSHELIHGLRAENEALKCEIERLLYEMRSVGAAHDIMPERMGRILPYDDKRSETPIQPVRSGGGGGKKTSF